MHQNKSVSVNTISLVVMSIFTIMELANKQTTVFYMLYLFWFDEFIKTIFEGITYHFKKPAIVNTKQFLATIKDRLFLLSVYFIFIVVFFGLMINWKDFDLIAFNLMVFFFKNWFFNFSLLTFTSREIYLYKKRNRTIETENLFSTRILILHIALLLGILFWLLSTQKFQFLKDYATIFAIIPFLLLKVIVEIKSEK